MDRRKSEASEDVSYTPFKVDRNSQSKYMWPLTHAV